MQDELLTRVKELFSEARQMLVFTGAGISTGSGIPDFRGPQGVWKRRQPVYFDDFCSSYEKRVEYWNYKLEGYQGFRDAQPNAAHKAIVDWHQRGILLGLVTQNIDGLHVLAGLPEEKVVEIHGTNRLIACISCDFREPPARAFEEFEKTGKPPLCPRCEGLLKPATISFGQALEPATLGQAFAWSQECDLVVSLGSTLSVHPAASVPAQAAERGIPYVVVNQGPTDHDRIATLRLQADLVELLPKL